MGLYSNRARRSVKEFTTAEMDTFKETNNAFAVALQNGKRIEEYTFISFAEIMKVYLSETEDGKKTENAKTYTAVEFRNAVDNEKAAKDFLASVTSANLVQVSNRNGDLRNYAEFTTNDSTIQFRPFGAKDLQPERTLDKDKCVFGYCKSGKEWIYEYSQDRTKTKRIYADIRNA